MKLSYVPGKIADDEEFKLIDFEDVRKFRYMISTYGRVFDIKREKDLMQNDKEGYRVVKLKRINGKQRLVFVHRLVAEAFIPKSLDENGNERNLINHKDLRPWNNKVENLEWCTQKENVIHAYLNDAINFKEPKDDEHEYYFIYYGKKRGWINQSGEGNNNAKLTNDQVHEICKGLEKGKTTKEILKDIGLEFNNNTKALISNIRQGRRWKSISSQYNISKLFEKKTKTITPYIRKICELILNGYSNEEIIEIIPHTDYSDDRFKTFIDNIRKKKNHQAIFNEIQSKLTQN